MPSSMTMYKLSYQILLKALNFLPGQGRDKYLIKSFGPLLAIYDFFTVSVDLQICFQSEQQLSELHFKEVIYQFNGYPLLIHS